MFVIASANGTSVCGSHFPCPVAEPACRRPRPRALGEALGSVASRCAAGGGRKAVSHVSTIALIGAVLMK